MFHTHQNNFKKKHSRKKTKVIIQKMLSNLFSDQVATEDNNNTVYETDCSNCEAFYSSEPAQSL